MEKEVSTEQKILDAAEYIFHEKGFDGARMQEIAEQAGINKGLLHYYFKTKDKLFEGIFSMALNKMISKIRAIIELEISVEDKINRIVDQYMALLTKNPNTPKFVLNELNKNPDKFINKHINKEVKNAFAIFMISVQKEVDQNKIKQIDARQLFMNLMALIIFPFVGRPLLQGVFGIATDEFKQLLDDRKVHIKEFIFNALRV